MEKRLKGATIIFDLDGTLVDTAGDLAASMNYALDQGGLAPVPTADVRHLVGHGGRRMLMLGYEIAAGRNAGPEELDAAFTHFTDHYEENIAVHSRPFDGVTAIIGRMRADGASVAICTNKRERLAVLLIKELGLTGLFDTIVGADTAGVAKPDPAPVRLCLERTDATRAVFIGDSDTDIRAAEAAGLLSYIAEFGYGPTTLGARAAKLFQAYDADFEQSLRSALAV